MIMWCCVGGCVAALVVEILGYCAVFVLWLFLVRLVLYAYLRHAVLWVVVESHDRRCRSSVVGYADMSPSGALPSVWRGDVSPRCAGYGVDWGRCCGICCCCGVSPRCRWLRRVGLGGEWGQKKVCLN